MKAPIWLSVSILLAGCASIDFDYPRTESVALVDTSDTYWGQQLAGLKSEQPPDRSGFHPMRDGIDALSARLLLAERAERSIDIQYYLIKNDVVGQAFLNALVKAADRGVRVRLLLDDIFTSGYDVGMAALDSHPNFEIRIFNPFNRGAVGRTLGAATSFSRINRRMHNKSFTVDNQVTIIGGRNIAGEYFGAREDAKFGDLDVVAVGPVVGEVSAMFDTYWNHETALPVPAFLDPLEDPEAALAGLRSRLAARVEEARSGPYGEAVVARVLHQIESQDDAFVWAPYELVWDSPDKGVGERAEEAGSILTPLLDALQAANTEVLIVSPYFVPRKDGIEFLAGLRRSAINVTVITNSLAANNQAAVHGGYAPSRKPLLEAGVNIYEVRPDADVAGTEFIDASGAKATLHTKAFIVDRSRVFIGSFNFDPRSARLNTEMGVIIDDPEMGSQSADWATQHLPTDTYTVFLDDGDLRWRGLDDGREIILDKEPQTTWWQRFKAGFARILPIRGQL